MAVAENAKPSAWFPNPRDLVTLRKIKTTDGQYVVHPDPAEGVVALRGVTP